MIRFVLCAAALGALVACQPAVPDSGAGVGFDRIDAERRARDAQLQGGFSQPAPIATAPLGGSFDSAEANAAAQARAGNSGVAPIEANPSNPAPGASNSGISSEQDFDSVSTRRSIEADAARVRANAAQYQVIAPTTLPSRAGNTGPNVVEYALRTTHPRGQRIYRRTGIGLQAKFQRNCAGYASPDEAQIDFLAQGGPERDRRSLDPDGDGYACGWDPAPFRAVAAGRANAAPRPSIVPAGAISSE